MTGLIAKARNCKIVATVGPSSKSPHGLALIARAGVNVFRINFSHGERADHAKVIEAIRVMEQNLDMPVAVLADLQGPKIRVGDLNDGEMELRYDQTIELVCRARQDESGASIPIPHQEIFEVSQPGDQLLFDELWASIMEYEKSYKPHNWTVDITSPLSPLLTTASMFAYMSCSEISYLMKSRRNF